MDAATNSPQTSKIQNKNNGFKQVNQTLYFNEAGEESYTPTDEAVAVAVTTDDGTLFKVTVNRKRDLFNPYDEAYLADSKRMGKIQNLEPYQMIKTNEECFKSYIKYLKHGVSHDLTVAQRGL